MSAQNLMHRKSYINLMDCFPLNNNGRSKKPKKPKLSTWSYSKQKKITGMEAIS